MIASGMHALFQASAIDQEAPSTNAIDMQAPSPHCYTCWSAAFALLHLALLASFALLLWSPNALLGILSLYTVC
jgi:hypothetical protein